MKSLISLLLALVLSAPLWAIESVNINTADAETIADSLNGVGASKAQAIVDYREANGDFEHPDELVNVKGIGLKTLDKNRDAIRVSDDEKEVTEE